MLEFTVIVSTGTPEANVELATRGCSLMNGAKLALKTFPQ
jgi:hypothetical protein